MKLIKKYFYLLILLIFFLCRHEVKAADFRSDYNVDYYIEQNNDHLATYVKFSIKITNFRSDVYVKKFSIYFPKNFIIRDIKASDDKGKVEPVVNIDSEATKINLEFTDPSIGKDTINNFYLEFYQDNLFNINGNVWEVILPTVENNKDSIYRVVVNLPANTDKKISIAKPIPDYISGNQLIWNNPKTKTIYAVFGKEQLYQMELAYNLKNEQLRPVYIDIAFPPDTLYQKIYVNSINPQPSLIYLDDDGNYLGRYYLAPTENKIVTFSGIAEIFSSYREDVLPIMTKQLENQKNYLLTSNKYWNITNLDKINDLKNVSDIYYFTVNTLKYDYKRAGNNLERMGADKVLMQPNKAVCVEFTDLFIAATREKGILSREIQGYGFTQDPQLRPLSLTSDILHSWPEYYDNKNKIWIPVDPTWQNTSGIDYFSSLDLNHIAFIIHGKKADYPLSAGMYKQENSKDILIKATSLKPQDKIAINIEQFSLPNMINDKEKYKNKIKIINNSNVFLWQVPIKISGTNLFFIQNEYIIDEIAPMQNKEIEFEYQANVKNIKTTATFEVKVGKDQVISKSLTIFPYYYDLGLRIAYITLFTCVLLFLILKFFPRKKRE